MAGRQIRRGTKAQRVALGGLAVAELGFETDTKDIYIGATGGDHRIPSEADINALQTEKLDRDGAIPLTGDWAAGAFDIQALSFSLPYAGILKWGASNGHPEISLYRGGGGVCLETNYEIRIWAADGGDRCFGVKNNTVTQGAFATDADGDIANRFRITVAGDMYWGPGTDVPDIHLYRLQAGMLACSEDFYTAGDLMIGGLALLYQNLAMVNKAGDDWIAILQINKAGLETVCDLANIGTITFGGDTNLYRLVENYLATDDSFYVAQNLQVTGLVMLRSGINIMNKDVTDSLPIMVRDISGAEAVGLLTNIAYMKITEFAEADVVNGSIYVSVADHVLYFKDSSGTSHALY